MLAILPIAATILLFIPPYGTLISIVWFIGAMMLKRSNEKPGEVELL